MEQFYSRQFQDREDGLLRLRNFLKEHEVEEETPCNEHAASPNKVARSAALLLHRAVRDAVYSVFGQATETVRVLFLEYVPGRVSPSEVARCVDRLLPELLAKSGDPSARLHTLAQHTILSIAACPEVAEQHLVAPALSRSVGSGTHQRLAMSRLQMLEQLVHTQGISTDKHSGLTCRALSECGCSGIHHPAEPVRKVAERILLLVYKVNPRLVRKQLPPTTILRVAISFTANSSPSLINWIWTASRSCSRPTSIQEAVTARGMRPRPRRIRPLPVRAGALKAWSSPWPAPATVLPAAMENSSTMSS